ncbi:winged helix-turn-helix domain-containing protein [Streptomyces sp. NBC_00433]
MLRIDMGAAALANTRFALSPLHTTVEALFLLRPDARPAGAWKALLRQTLRDHRLTLLAALFGDSWDYLPDFIKPQPEMFEPGLQDELHTLVSTDPARLRWELEGMARGNTELNVHGRPSPRIVKELLERGERALPERLAAELQRVWQAAIRPHWAVLRARMESDIAYRSQALARHGMSAMLTGLHSRIVWQDDHVRLMTRFRGSVPGTTHVVLTPSVFITDLQMTLDAVPGPARRQPMLAYPARRGPEDRLWTPTTPPAQKLLGVTRARLLADLGSPRSTAELSERHFLAVGTVSYHLGILHRAGLITRTRARHHVLYQRTVRAGDLLDGTDEPT